MNKAKQIFRWVMFLGWLGLGVYAFLTESEENWRVMFAGACFLLSMVHMVDT